MTGNLFLYAVTVFIWGSTWLGIKMQLGYVDPLVSVVYRFCLAALFLFGWCLFKRLSLRFNRQDHLFIALQGASLFAVNYWLFYLAETHLSSGIVAVIFSTIVFWNVLIGRIFLKTPVQSKVIFGAVLGIGGIALVYWPEIAHFDQAAGGFKGLAFSLAATLLASCGNILSARNQHHGLSVITTNTVGMAYGAAIMLIVALLVGKSFRFDPSVTYMGSLFYLALFGSVIAFGSYLTLVGRIGAGRAAYATLLFPIIALLLATFFEGYQWSLPAMAGVVIILAGNLIILKQPKQLNNKKIATVILRRAA